MIKLSSGPLRIVAIKKKTQAHLLRDVKVGDVLVFSMLMDGYWNYASYVLIENITQGTRTSKTLSKAADTMGNCFTVEAEE